jgi:hypothetical protein
MTLTEADIQHGEWICRELFKTARKILATTDWREKEKLQKQLRELATRAKHFEKTMLESDI